MYRNIPKVFLDIIMSWHDGLVCHVRWDNVYSEWFPLSAGVRQGGVLSPDFYSIYVDDLINILRNANVGCYFQKIFAAAIFYADDMAVLAPSVKGLQKLLTHVTSTALNGTYSTQQKQIICVSGKEQDLFTTPTSLYR